ncbi:hypothetical protein PCASD_13327 [Puccinia coronata f. sp. avenae]|uniref:Uncharacterized protein n=1 Tax=Puccinia coronata f. sp. avenae TaxID=200324 RepID=A0A2N5SUK6_9BASI|nr:hypothetical protein PCASD_13327 [Puccinia coronata f. sp. avenae]
MAIKPGRQQCLLKISWAAIGGEVHVGQSDRKGCADNLSGTCQEDSDGKIHGESEKPKASGTRQVNDSLRLLGRLEEGNNDACSRLALASSESEVQCIAEMCQ